MIVRILSEGQYQLPGAVVDDLNVIDNQMVDAVAVQDEPRFRSLLGDMVGMVRERGNPVPVTDLAQSDLILPEADLTMAEAASIFTGDGIFKG